jgi:Tol biopolymer transport system component
MADLDGVPVRVLVLRDRLTGVTRVLLNGGRLPNGGCGTASISSGGDMIAFGSSATNLVDGNDANGSGDDVYVLDAASMMFRRVSLDSNGRQSATGSSFAPAISADGRYVAFSSTAPLDRPRPSRGRDVKTYVDVYRRDLTLGVTTRISVAADGGVANGSSYEAAISADGRYVAFVSDATNLVKRRDGNRAPDVYLRDTVAGVTELVSRTRSGESANGPSAHPAISHDGRVVVFQSEASDLACGADCVVADRDINLVADIFAHDRVRGATQRVSRGTTQWMEPSIGPAIDASGGVIAFSSRHPLDAADDRDDYDLFVWSPGR